MTQWTSNIVKVLVDEMLSAIKARGIDLFAGVEIEFYLRHKGLAPSAVLVEKFAASFPDLKLEKEKGAGQYEFAMPHMSVLDAIDGLCKLRSDIKEVAEVYGMEAIFEPKPFENDYGSALHVHMSLYDNEARNILEDSDDVMRKAISSILDLVRTDLDFICGEEDLKRLQPGWMAPSHLAWGGNNRTVVVRVPEGEKRVEFRLPSANADVSKVMLFMLVAVFICNDDTPQYERVYGNAHDAQYNLPKLEISNNMSRKRFASPDGIYKYINLV